MLRAIAGLAVLLGCCRGIAVMKVRREEASVHAAAASAFMLVAGVTSPKEMCIASSGGHVALEPCAEALAAGDGAPCSLAAGDRRPTVPVWFFRPGAVGLPARRAVAASGQWQLRRRG